MVFSRHCSFALACRLLCRRQRRLFYSVLLLCGPLLLALPAPAAQGQAGTQRAIGAEIDATGLILSGYAGLRMEKVPAEQRYLLAYWRRILEEHDPEAAFGKGQKDLPSHHLEQWKNLSARMPGLGRMEQLRYINGFFNNFPSRSDKDLYGREDYWATPEEFMSRRAGDCEDYAVVKYLALRHFGWSAEEMWLLIVRNRKSRERHAVLAARNGERIFILDNLSRPVYQLVPEKTFMTGFVPLFAINEDGFWYFAGTDDKDGNSAARNEGGFKSGGNGPAGGNAD